MRIFFVAPDYHEGTAEEVRERLGQHVPHRRARRHGAAVPHRDACCRASTFPNVREHGLREIWFESDGFNRYRGTGWMKEPCRSCETGSRTSAAAAARPTCWPAMPANADPVCDMSPHHRSHLGRDVVAKAQTPSQPVRCIPSFRDDKNSRALSGAGRREPVA